MDDLQKKLEVQTNQIHELKSTVANMEADAKVTSAGVQERLKKEHQKLAQTIKELNSQKDLEVRQTA